MKTWIAKLGLTALTAATLLLPGATTFASSSTLYVDDDKKQCSSAQFTDVQAAVNAAKSGDTIYVCPGTYHENVTITKKLTLQGKKVSGQALPVIATPDNGGFDPILKIQNAPDVRIRDLRLVGTNSEFGVLAEKSTHLTVEKLVIDDVGAGIVLRDGSNKGVIQKNTISQGEAAIAVLDSKEAKVKNNTLKASGQGLGFGIYVQRADKTTASNNTISDTEIGIYVETSSSVQVSSNTVTTPHEVGIRLEDVNKSTVRKNTVTDSKNNGIGLISGGGDNRDNTLEENTIKNSANQDAHDTSVGNKTAGTANTWEDNTCVTSDPAGLCKK